MRPVSILVGGVGGQGVILTARVLAEAALASGLEAQMSEVHGMSQRYGSVVSTVRIGRVATPLVKHGEADAIVGLEPLETVRLLSWASRETVIVTALVPIRPLGVNLGLEAYPTVEDLLGRMRERAARVIAIDAQQVAQSIGEGIVANAVLLGALQGTQVVPIPLEAVRASLLRRVPSRFAAANLEALDIGYGVAVQDQYSLEFANLRR